MEKLLVDLKHDFSITIAVASWTKVKIAMIRLKRINKDQEFYFLNQIKPINSDQREQKYTPKWIIYWNTY
jgi:hypothetical protein